MPTAAPRSAASSALNRPIDVDDGDGHRLDLHRSGGRAGRCRRRAPGSREEDEHAGADSRFQSSGGSSDAGVGVEFRSILGAMLAQERDRVAEAAQPWTAQSLPDGIRVVTKRQPTADEWEALRFAWRICAHVKSNAIIFTDANRTLAIGAGQMSRVDAANVAVMKARRGHVGGIGRGLGRLLSVPRRPRRRRSRWSDGGRPAGRIGQRSKSD